MATILQNLGLTAKPPESLGDILSVFDTVSARLDTFRVEQDAVAASEEAQIAELQASLTARRAEIERADRVKEKVTAITS